ncbi:PD-(D/E)XK nuclease domain-containing protein, partial [Lachnospiraceae bacterium 29-91]
MTAGERIRIVLQGYAATEAALETKNQIYSAMVVYGLLTYEDGAVFIPNKELMDKYNELLLTNDSLGYVHRLAKASEKMLSATLSGDTKTMTEILKFAHDTESPILSYNSEIELSAVINLVYLSARDRYRVEREDKAGEGFVDFIFYPENRNAVGIILELKVDSTPEEALQQIIAKNYILRFEGKIGERAKYQGKILGVGISYN